MRRKKAGTVCQVDQQQDRDANAKRRQTANIDAEQLGRSRMPRPTNDELAKTFHRDIPDSDFNRGFVICEFCPMLWCASTVTKPEEG